MERGLFACSCCCCGCKWVLSVRPTRVRFRGVEQRSPVTDEPCDVWFPDFVRLRLYFLSVKTGNSVYMCKSGNLLVYNYTILLRLVLFPFYIHFPDFVRFWTLNSKWCVCVSRKSLKRDTKHFRVHFRWDNVVDPSYQQRIDKMLCLRRTYQQWTTKMNLKTLEINFRSNQKEDVSGYWGLPAQRRGTPQRFSVLGTSTIDFSCSVQVRVFWIHFKWTKNICT